MTKPFVSRDVTEVALRLCEGTATPRALTVAILLRYEEWDQLVSLQCDPGMYSSPQSYYSDVVVTDFFRKVEDLPTSFDRKAVALENFWKSERECYRTNRFLHRFLPESEFLQDSNEVAIAEFITRCRKNMRTILGPCPVKIDGKFGPGATYADKGQYTTVPDKMSSCPTFTSASLSFLPSWSKTMWARACSEAGRDLIVVKGNRFTTVPKDCRKDRGICVEPSVNLFFQLGVGRVLKRALRKAGIDLTSAQDIHKQVACEASKQGHLSTLDLSNASDTICSNLVKLLLPTDWYQVLHELRSPFTLVEGKQVFLEKFSSMGNGYTFELETAIFYCICKTAVESDGCEAIPHRNVFVYGDDMIVPTDSAPSVIAALRFFGFSLNSEKSFVSGPFRESCGGDYFDGMDVRPFHLKELPHEPQHYIALANGLWRLGHKDPSHPGLHPRFLRAWFCVLDAIPSNIRRCRGPADLGDLVITDEETRWNTRWRSSIRYVRVYRPHKHRKVKWSLFEPLVVLAGATYGCGWGNGGVTPRDSVISHKVGWSAYS